VRRALVAIGLGGLVLASARPAGAGPVVIRDALVSDTGITPVLGRGYSIATNTYQSICLVDAPKTKPSYNFVYNFAEIDSNGTETKDLSVNATANGKSDNPLVQVQGETSASYTDTNNETWFKHSMKVSIDIDVYYASVDESKAKLAEAPTKLLQANDIPGFFDACGPYYLRSINRRATYLSVFSYESKESKRDVTFENRLKLQITSAVGEVTSETTVKGGFSSQMSEKRTTIRSYGFGLGKDERAELVAYDIATFKAAIKSAFLSMQSDDVGIVTSIEVVPWAENPLFQALVVLPNAEITDPSTGQKRRVSPYAQKRILNLNSEFLAELDRAARAKLNVFYKAKMCKNDIEMNYMVQQGAGFKFTPVDIAKPDGPTWGSRLVLNNRTRADRRTLESLYAELLPQRLNTIFLEYESFVYGGTGKPLGLDKKDPAAVTKLAELAFKLKSRPDEYPSDAYPGVTTCVGDLVTDGFSLRSYRAVPTCSNIEQTFPVVAGRAIDDYCMVTMLGGDPSAEEKAREATR
jgi:hypothetical protein